MPELFAKCCMCGKEIHKGDTYCKCTVSACNSGRLKLFFCSPGCGLHRAHRLNKLLAVG